MATGNASEDSVDGFAVLHVSSQEFSATLRQFRVCHDLYMSEDNEIFDKEMQTLIDQCAVDFRQMSLHTAELSERVASVWCGTCILFFGNLSRIKGDPSKVLKKISSQAQDLSSAFKTIGACCRELAANFHSVDTKAARKSKEYSLAMESAREEAEKTMEILQADLNKAAAEAEKQRKRANRWTIATLIPVVNVFAGIGAMVTARWAFDAEKIQRDVQCKSDNAKAELAKCSTDREKAKVRYFANRRG